MCVWCTGNVLDHAAPADVSYSGAALMCVGAQLHAGNGTAAKAGQLAELANVFRHVCTDLCTALQNIVATQQQL